MLGFDGNIFLVWGRRWQYMVLTDGEGSAVGVTDDGSAVAILSEGTVILGRRQHRCDRQQGQHYHNQDGSTEESEGNTIITNRDRNAVVLVAERR